MPRLVAVMALLGALTLGACAQDLEGVSATGFYGPDLEAQRNATDPLFGPPDGPYLDGFGA